MAEHTRRILVVDPDTFFANRLNSRLSSLGYDVEIMGKITPAVERLKDVDFDCVIMDEALPEMKGYDAVPILKALRPEVIVIVTASKNNPGLESRIRQQDVFYYFVKSFALSELELAVRDAFRKIGKDQEAEKASARTKILIVDDDVDFTDALRRIFEPQAYEVHTAHNKDDAIGIIEKEKPDLVLLDVIMDSLTDGVVICNKVKNDHELKHIPVLIMSSVAEMSGYNFTTKTAITKFEADDFIAKPVKPSEMLMRVEKFLA